MLRVFVFTLWGYLSGSVLYARVWSSLLHKKDIFACSKDQNPGTANAFCYGGFLCGALTLLCDVLKGFFPIHVYLTGMPLQEKGLAYVMAAPVIGHIFSLFNGFHGGKGIAVTFGCLLGLAPESRPLGFLIIFFLFFSFVLRITPHFYRTIAAYIGTLIAMAVCFPRGNAYFIGFLLITAAVCFRLHNSKETREKLGVKLLWMH